VPHKIQGQGGRDQEGAGVVTQHRTTAGPYEVVRQGRRCHTVVACCFASLCLGGGGAP